MKIKPLIMTILVIALAAILSGCPGSTNLLQLLDAEVSDALGQNEYELTVIDDGNGSTSPFGVVTANHGKEVNISANEDIGYDFDVWTVTSGEATFTDAGSALTTVILTSGDATVRANFVRETYTLTVTNDGAGSASPGSVAVQYGVPRNIYASPNRFQSFDRWIKTGGTGSVSFADSLSRYTNVTVTGGDVTIEAQFKATTYSLTKRGELFLNTVGYLTIIDDIQVDGNNLYISGSTGTNGGVMKIDITSRTSPTVTATRTTASGGRVTGIALADTKIWAADRSNGMYTFDRSTFAVENNYTSYSPDDVAPHSKFGTNFAFAAINSQVREYYDNGSSMSSGDYANATDSINQVATEGYYGFATATDGDTGQFISFDLGTGSQGDLTVADTIPNITSGFGTAPNEFLIHEGEIAYLACYDDGLISVWVDDPTGMSVADTLAMTNDPFDIGREYYSSDTYYKELLFTASKTGTGKYDFIDIGTWSNPQVVATFDTFRGADPSCIAVDGNYLYAVEDNHNYIIIYEIGID